MLTWKKKKTLMKIISSAPTEKISLNEAELTDKISEEEEEKHLLMKK